MLEATRCPGKITAEWLVVKVRWERLEAASAVAGNKLPAPSACMITDSAEST